MFLCRMKRYFDPEKYFGPKWKEQLLFLAGVGAFIIFLEWLKG